MSYFSCEDFGNLFLHYDIIQQQLYTLLIIFQRKFTYSFYIQKFSFILPKKNCTFQWQRNISKERLFDCPWTSLKSHPYARVYFFDYNLHLSIQSSFEGDIIRKNTRTKVSYFVDNFSDTHALTHSKKPLKTCVSWNPKILHPPKMVNTNLNFLRLNNLIIGASFV